MRFLLDTHVWLWSLLEPARLGPITRAALQSAEARLWLSPVSVWEAHMLAEKGRIQLGTPPGDWIAGALRRSPVREAGLTHPIALLSRTVALPHADPADRFIAATAIALDLELLTADEILLASAVPTRSCRE